MMTKRSYLSAEVPESAKVEFEAEAYRRGIKPATLLREAVYAHTGIDARIDDSRRKPAPAERRRKISDALRRSWQERKAS